MLLALPQTYMNASGEAVRALCKKHGVDPSELCVVVDDIDLPLGTLRMRAQGSAGGQKGMPIGHRAPRHHRVSAPARGHPRASGTRGNATSADYVLEPFAKGERAQFEDSVGRAVEALRLWLTHGIDAAMRRANVLPSSPDQPRVRIDIHEEEQMRLYDIVVLVTPDLSDEDAAKVAAEYKKILVDGGANVVKDEPWGRRRLAFPILRKREAHYHYWQVEARAGGRGRGGAPHGPLRPGAAAPRRARRRGAEARRRRWPSGCASRPSSGRPRPPRAGAGGCRRRRPRARRVERSES